MTYHWKAVDRSLARRLRGWRRLFHTTVPSSSSSSSSCQSTCPGGCVHCVCVCYEDEKHYHKLAYQFLLQNPSCSRTTGFLLHPPPSTLPLLLPPLSPSSPFHSPTSSHTVGVICFLNLILQQLPPLHFLFPYLPLTPPPPPLFCPLLPPPVPSLHSFHLLLHPFHALTFGAVCFVCLTGVEALCRGL